MRATLAWLLCLGAGPFVFGKSWWLAWSAVVTAVAAWSWLRARSPTSFRVADDKSVEFNGERIDAAAIVNAMTVDVAPRGQLVLHLRDGASRVVDFETPEQAAEGLSMLGLDEKLCVTRVPLYSTTQLAMHNVFGGFLGFVTGMIPALIARAALGPSGTYLALPILLLCSFGWAGVLRKLLPQLVIGSDGVASGTTTNTAVKFEPYENIEGVKVIRRDQRKAPGGWAIDLVVRDGPPRQLTHFPAEDDALAQALAQRIETAMAQKRQRGGRTVAGLTELESHGDDPARWLERLRAFSSSKSDYRQARIEDEQLRAALSDVDAPLDRRLAAGMMLRIREPNEGRARSREAAERAADPATREALLALAEAEADEAALEAASKVMKR